MLASSNNLPPGLQKYVQRCFSQIVTDKDKVVTERYLDTIIKRKIEDGTIWSKDWEQEPLPTLPSSMDSKKQKKNFLIPQKRKFSQQFSDSYSDYETSQPPTKRQKGFEPEKIVGSCELVEKDYLRNIDSRAFIRPLSVLKLSLKNIKEKYLKGKVKYEWICNQFKSIRQDLRMQNIENDFTVRVYESHARIALQNSDSSEFNQCLSVLFHLYKIEKITKKNMNEFIGYKIIYLSFTNNEKELQDFLKGIYTNYDIINSIYFKHAITLHSALKLNNYYKIFNYLTLNSPKMSKYLIEYFKMKYLLKYLAIIFKSHVNTHISLECIMKNLGLKNEMELKNFLVKNNLLFEGNNVDCKANYRILLQKGVYS